MMEICTHCHWHEAWRGGLCAACIETRETNMFYSLRHRLFTRWGDMDKAAMVAALIVPRRMRRLGFYVGADPRKADKRRKEARS